MCFSIFDDRSLESELKYKMEADAVMTEAKGLRLEVDRLKRETQEHQAKDPVLYEQIKVNVQGNKIKDPVLYV